MIIALKTLKNIYIFILRERLCAAEWSLHSSEASNSHTLNPWLNESPVIWLNFWSASWVLTTRYGSLHLPKSDSLSDVIYVVPEE